MGISARRPTHKPKNNKSKKSASPAKAKVTSSPASENFSKNFHPKRK